MSRVVTASGTKLPSISDIDARQTEMTLASSRPSPGQRIVEIAGLATLGVLLFLWSVPGVIAARNGLLGLLLLLAIAMRPSPREVIASLRQGGTAAWLLLLTLWIALHCALLAWEPHRAWHEAAQWFKVLPIIAVGCMLGCAPRWRQPSERVQGWCGVLVLAYLLYLVFQVIYKPWALHLSLVQTLTQTTLIGSRDLGSYLSTALVAVLLADLVAQAAGRSRLLGGPVWLRIAALALGVLLTVATVTRNALPILFLLGLVAAACFIATRPANTRHRAILGVLVAAALTAAVVAVAVRNDPRWARLSTSVAIGLDIAHQKAWLAQETIELPKDAKGDPVDDSAYMRTAWMKGLITEIGRHPLGVGYDRNAFGMALRKDYGDWVTTGHGHAGMLDFTLGVGIPGGLMLLAFMGSLVLAGARAWHTRRDAAGLALVLFVLAYGSRAFIDGIVRDHMLEQFMFCAGLLLALAHSQSTDTRA